MISGIYNFHLGLCINNLVWFTLYTNVLLFRPPNMPISISKTPRKVLRERVNNYKNMFEMSMKENNELREFTTLERQMFYENVSNVQIQFNILFIIIILLQNEQLKELGNLRKCVDDLLIEKNESAKQIEKMKCSIQLIENEKRDIEVIMVMQKDKYEKRETELLATIRVSTLIKQCTISDFCSIICIIYRKREKN